MKVGKLVGSVLTVTVSGKPPEDHPVYAKIGRVASDWSHVEHLLDVIIWDLTGPNRRETTCLISQFNGHYARFEAILALLEQKGLLTKELRRKIKRVSGDCGPAGQKRNRIVHDAWFVTIGPEPDETPRPYRKMPKEDLKFGFVNLPNDHFASALNEIEERRKEVSALRDEILQLLSSRGKAR